MNKTLALLASTAVITLSAQAFAADKETHKSETKIERDAKGNYEASTATKSTDAAGTTTKTEKSVDVDVDADGATERTVKTEQVTDPKGLFNKEKVKTTDKVKTNADGTVESSHKKTVNGKTVEDTHTTH